MERGTVGFIEPVSRVERYQLDFSAFGQFSGLINDKTTGLDSSLQCHVTTVGLEDWARNDVFGYQFGYQLAHGLRKS